MKKPKDKKKAEKLTKPLPSSEEKKDQFDFGGLPPRDLKKNLGC